MRYQICFGILLATNLCIAQSALQPLSTQHYHWLDRYDILLANPSNLHTSVKSISRINVIKSVYEVDSIMQHTDFRDINLQWLADDNNFWRQEVESDEKIYTDSTHTFYTYDSEWEGRRLVPAKSKRPILKHFYKTPAHLFEVNTEAFFLRVNPLLNFGFSKVNNQSDLLFVNQRGIALHGGIDQKVYFHTEILESQALYPDYVQKYQQKFSAVPGVGFYKNYRSRIFNVTNGIDFLLANAYFGAHISPHVNIELGHGRHFIGNGIRSLFLSDFSTEYFYLKLNTQVWKFQYQNIFGELVRPNRLGGDMLLPKKYFAAHYLSLNIRPNLNIGLFETVVFSRQNQFELQYLNPIILYRTVEGSLGSPDNVLLGIDLKWNIQRRASFYTQFILDEFKIGELTKGDGWWANKFGWQVGLKYLDLFGISQLDAQLEYNTVRPYTYSHREGLANYSHYNQALAHPLGANFREGIMRVNYQPTQDWSFTLRALSMKTGEDIDTLNYGSNILLSNSEHVGDYGNEVGQGIASTINLFGLDISYQIRHGLYLDLNFQTRDKESALDIRNNKTTYIGGGVRWNLDRKNFDF